MGHETTYVQIASDLLGLPPETFRYVQGDTATVRAGNGHGGARSMHMGGTALVRTAEIVLRKAEAVAARLLQADKVTFANGRFSVVGDPDRHVGLLDVAAAENIDTYNWNVSDVITFPNGCHIAEVEVDPATGHVRILRYKIGRAHV